MSLWQTVTWDVARAGGFTAYVLLTLSVAIGLALTLQWQSGRWPRLLNSELHNFLSLLALVFTAVHVLAVWVDPFTRFGLAEVFVPMVSHYRPLWMAFGIVGLYLGLAIGLSTWVRPLIGYAWWRRLHVLTLVLYGLVSVHGIATGSDTRTVWGVLIYAGSITLVGGLLFVRLLMPATPKGRAHPGFAALTALSLATLAMWTVLGPLQSGWNASANNGNGSGARVALAAGNAGQQVPSQGAATPPSSATPTPPASSSGNDSTFAAGFTSNATGTLTQQGPDGAGNVTMTMDLTLSGATSGTLTLQLQGTQGGGDDGGGTTITSTSVVLGTSSAPQLYSGRVTSLRAGATAWRVTAAVSSTGGSALSLRLRLTVDGSGQVSGTVQGTPTAGGNGGSNNSNSGGNTSGGNGI